MISGADRWQFATRHLAIGNAMEGSRHPIVCFEVLESIDVSQQGAISHVCLIEISKNK
jgi:hypothetical protein